MYFIPNGWGIYDLLEIQNIFQFVPIGTFSTSYQKDFGMLTSKVVVDTLIVPNCTSNSEKWNVDLPFLNISIDYNKSW